MGSKKYIHYGHSKFDSNLFEGIENRVFVKPWGGLWASPVDAENGWKDWCTREDFRVEKLEEHFVFTLRDNAKVLHIRSVHDLVDLPIDPKILELFPDGYNMTCLDFEKLLIEGYDAVELHLSEEIRSDGFMDGLYWELYGWDCDSILIMNTEVIVCE